MLGSQYDFPLKICDYAIFKVDLSIDFSQNLVSKPLKLYNYIILPIFKLYSQAEVHIFIFKENMGI